MSRHRRQQRKRMHAQRAYQRWFAAARQRLADRLAAGFMSLLNRPALSDPDWVDVAPPVGAVKARVNQRTGVLEMQMEQPLRYVTLTLNVPEGVNADLFAADLQEGFDQLARERE